MVGSGGSESGSVACGSWVRRPENVNFVVLGVAARNRDTSSTGVIEIFSFDPNTTSLSQSPLATYVLEESDGDPVTIALHPSGDNFVCSTSNGSCKLFEIFGGEADLKLYVKELLPLQSVGVQQCLGFSVDGSRLAAGGVDGCLRILEWPGLRIVLDEPRAHKSVHDMDFSLDSEYLASTSTDGSARIWKAEDGVPVASLPRNSDEVIELCRFSKDGTKPFLFCAAQRGGTAVVTVYDINTWKRLGYKRLIRKPASTMAISLDGKYLALGSKDGDISIVEVKKMEIYHYSKMLHLGQSIATLEFCPGQRVLLTTSAQGGAVLTKLNVPADWKDWQIYLLLSALFLASAVACYIFFKKSDSFWKFPLGKEQPRPKISLFGDSKPYEDPNMFNPFGPVDM